MNTEVSSVLCVCNNVYTLSLYQPSSIYTDLRHGLLLFHTSSETPLLDTFVAASHSEHINSINKAFTLVWSYSYKDIYFLSS